MDWSKIKTIFIISFLILDIYLMYEFFKIWDASQYEVVKTESEASIEKRLMADEIDYVTLPKGYVEDHYLKAKPKVFKDEDLKKSVLADQTVSIDSGTTLESTLDKPLKISDKFGPSELNSFIKSQILYGEDYRFWEKSKDGTMIIYSQNYEGKTLFENVNGKIIFQIEDNEIVSYRQTYLEEIDKLSKSEKIIQPIKAIETLYTNGLLKPHSSITEPELGYYTLVPLSDKAQVLNPAWCFVVNGKERLFVSAFEGEIVELNENNVVE